MTLPELKLVPVKEEESTTTASKQTEEKPNSDQPSTMKFKSKYARKTSVSTLHDHKVRNPSALRLNLVPELKVLPARRTSVTYYPYARPQSAGIPIKQPDGQTRYFASIPHPPPSPIYHQHPPPSPIYHQYPHHHPHHPHPPPSPIYHHHPTTVTANTTHPSPPPAATATTAAPHSPTHHQPPPPPPPPPLHPTQLYVPYRPQFYYLQRCYPQRVYYPSPPR